MTDSLGQQLGRLLAGLGSRSGGRLGPAAIAAARRREEALRKIEAALDRMKEGAYGYCLKCGDGISPDRLESDPATPLCRNCASEAQGGGASE